jgi:GNAT superfamily N-acetyltransferase
MSEPLVQISRLDEERFGVRTAKARIATVSQVPDVLESCRRQSVRLLMARCPANCLNVAQALEAAGAHLMDVLVYFARDLKTTPIPRDAGVMPVREAGPADADKIEAIARQAFHNYQGHYHADPRLDRAACDEVYASWARRSCLSPEAAHAVFVAGQGTELLGFLTVRLNNPHEVEICLNATAPSAQGRGIYHTLMLHALNWSLVRNCHRAIISTQVTNIAPQKVWIRVGFEPQESLLTFHRWFDT